jgi:hypothetical protein
MASDGQDGDGTATRSPQPRRAARDALLAEHLRDNLRKRKAQARERREAEASRVTPRER